MQQGKSLRDKTSKEIRIYKHVNSLYLLELRFLVCVNECECNVM